MAFLVAACQSAGSQNPRIKSEYLGKPTAEFFGEYGPPNHVIGMKQELKTDSTGRLINQTDPKELVYYWSSINRKSISKLPGSASNTCNLAILTSAEGKILLIEAQDEGGDIAAAKERCEAIID
ncbi:hypothetical protein [Roseibium sp. SCP14]|uniref:hypothetical protein n=1 Tax=Roseibium sp. SCP14 TaxID=3141375 RepID=UPI0033382033